ncbi:MAG: hypothetical protein ACYDBH_23950, partial [Acidobacteriaceae bacterium]
PDEPGFLNGIIATTVNGAMLGKILMDISAANKESAQSSLAIAASLGEKAALLRRQTEAITVSQSQAKVDSDRSVAALRDLATTLPAQLLGAVGEATTKLETALTEKATSAIKEAAPAVITETAQTVISQINAAATVLKSAASGLQSIASDTEKATSMKPRFLLGQRVDEWKLRFGSFIGVTGLIIGLASGIMLGRTALAPPPTVTIDTAGLQAFTDGMAIEHAIPLLDVRTKAVVLQALKIANAQNIANPPKP